MNPERLRQALAARQVLYGTWVQTPSAEVVEILGWSGWDFVILDLEHGPYGPEGLPHLIRAADASEATPFVRVPLSAPQEVGRPSTSAPRASSSPASAPLRPGRRPCA